MRAALIVLITLFAGCHGDRPSPGPTPQPKPFEPEAISGIVTLGSYEFAVANSNDLAGSPFNFGNYDLGWFGVQFEATTSIEYKNIQWGDLPMVRLVREVNAQSQLNYAFDFAKDTGGNFRLIRASIDGGYFFKSNDNIDPLMYWPVNPQPENTWDTYYIDNTRVTARVIDLNASSSQSENRGDLNLIHLLLTRDGQQFSWNWYLKPGLGYYQLSTVDNESGEIVLEP